MPACIRRLARDHRAHAALEMDSLTSSPTRTASLLSTTTILRRLHPNRAAISDANDVGTRIRTFKGLGMTEREERLAREREEIASRVASFRATQEKFRRAREEYFAATLDNARYGGSSQRTFERTPYWP